MPTMVHVRDNESFEQALGSESVGDERRVSDEAAPAPTPPSTPPHGPESDTQ